MSTSPVALVSITTDERLQPRRNGLDEAHIAALAETPEDWPPVVLAEADATLFLVDGFHRVEAARQLGFESIEAKIFEMPDDGDLFRIAFQLNGSHGRPLTLLDRKAYAQTLLQRNEDLSDRDIGRRTGLHHETVGALRRGNVSYRIPERKPGDLPDTIGLLDPIRRAKATRTQKAWAGYLQRLATALGDPYCENTRLNDWPDDPVDIARACHLTMGEERATKLFSEIEADARFILNVTKASKQLTKLNGGSK